MRIVGTIWLGVGTACFLTWILGVVVFLTDGFDVATVFMSFLMLVGAAITLFAAVLPSVAVATRTGIWIFGRGVISWTSVTDIRVAPMPFTWLDGYAVEITADSGTLTLSSTATYFSWGARRKQRALESIWKKWRRG